ncbi:unnamed protein product [Larinioides sclopetarius]|uniref:MATH domain-containing protein n=1 Tax=Larinioides sclopetarius TaxID=280406 RepID=A0AAV1Z056_9ARAC
MDDERVEYSFVCLIEDFSYCWHKNGEKLTSPVFYAVELEDTSWRMVLYPRGERVKTTFRFICLETRKITDQNMFP